MLVHGLLVFSGSQLTHVSLPWPWQSVKDAGRDPVMVAGTWTWYSVVPNSHHLDIATLLVPYQRAEHLSSAYNNLHLGSVTVTR